MSGTPAKSLPGADQQAAPPPSAPAPSVTLSNLPPTIPDHTIVCRIGGGSYGEVWLARSVLGELRAVKVISRSRFNDDRPFEREFGGIQRFEPISRSHPSQLAILHVGKNDDTGCFYYVMELADAAPNSNDECRNPKEPRSPNAENGTRSGELRASDFGLPSSSDIRHPT